MLQYDVEGKQKDAGLLTSVLADVGCGAPDGLASGVGRRRVLRRGTEVNSSDCCLPWSVLKAGAVEDFMEEPARDMGNKAPVKSKSEKPASLSRLASSIRFLAIRSSRSCS